MSLKSITAFVVGLKISAAVGIGLGSAAAKADEFDDTQPNCITNSCQRGPSLNDPPIISGDWQSFESSGPLVWGADVCLGYFLTKSETAWNGGTTNDQVDELHGLYLTLGGFLERVRIFDSPNDNSESPYADYGVFQCMNTRWPKHLVENVDTSEIEEWADSRLTSENGWTGGIEDWNLTSVGKFRNDVLGLTVEIGNQSGILTIRFAADYLGPQFSLMKVLQVFIEAYFFGLKPDLSPKL